MKRRLLYCASLCVFSALSAGGAAPKATLHVLAFYSTNVEHDHVDFAEQALNFYADASTKDQFDFSSTKNWNDLNTNRLKNVQIVIWLNDSPKTENQRRAFEQYMQRGGGWLGFHVAAYNDADTHWPWFLEFLGGGVFYGNNWPPLPATLNVDDKSSPITRHLPAQFKSPTNEWYIWKPSPRENKNIKVLLTLDPSNYPLGLKDTIKGGDLPVAWTNTKFRMIYMNMGHGDKIFASQQQNQLFEDALLWLGNRNSIAP